eukprot:3958876-Prymnesium_polylepis.1
MHAAGYALDPEFMQMASGMDDATQTGLISIIEKISLLEEKIEAEKESSAAADALTTASDKVQDRIATTMTELAAYQQGDGAFTKPYVIKSAKTMAPAVWWATYGKHVPHLAAVARRVLAQP